MNVRQTLSNMVPVPLAAPETGILNRKRRSIVSAFATLAALILAMPSADGTIREGMAILVAGIALFLLLEIAIYLRRKKRVDDLHLETLWNTEGERTHVQ